jgi:ABC-2 type transport system permease protein
MQMTFFVFLPQILLSGFIFPYAGMPKAAQWLAEILPMTHFVRLVRASMVRGAGMFELPNDLLALAAIAIVLLTLSTLRISKRLD